MVYSLIKIILILIFILKTEIMKYDYSVTEDGRTACGICNKVFNKPGQLRLHLNIHYFERPYRCENCAVSFRTKGHLTKHERSVSHHNKVNDELFSPRTVIYFTRIYK